MKVVLASNNPGKIREFETMLSSFPIELIPQADLGVEEVEESGLTFIENALIKARHASQETGLPSMADDSGLAVAALQGAPGIYSARYAGVNASSLDNIQKLLQALTHFPEKVHPASFHCVLVFMNAALDPIPLVCEGVWHGTIHPTPKGENGFGYDPIFYVPSLQKTAAELSNEVKNKISHRGQAIQLLRQKLPDKLCQLSPSKT